MFGRVNCLRRRARYVLPQCESVEHIQYFFLLLITLLLRHCIADPRINGTLSFPEKCLSLTLLTVPCDPDV
jgi:hypothetical protein